MGNDCLYGKADAKGLQRLNNTQHDGDAPSDPRVRMVFGNRLRLLEERLAA